MVTYNVEKELAEISKTGSTRKVLTLTSWNNSPAKLDLRIWRMKNGEEQPNKGVTLTIEEAEALRDALTAYLKR